MLVLVCYDVNTETKAGRRRLRRVARVCEGIGQRVQKSVFECQLDMAKFEALERELLAEIDPKMDCLRLYCIPPVSYTHLTLPTRDLGKNSVVAACLQNTKRSEATQHTLY